MNSSRSAHEIPGIRNCLVDGFRHKIDCIIDPRDRYYFLTHYHGDHYGGLDGRWSGGMIFCSEITSRLVINIMKVDPKWINAAPLGSSIRIPDVATVTFMDANHCPGAAILLFELDNGSCYLHTGDMRYHPKMKLYSSFNRPNLRIDKVFLDTTYAHPKHKFAPQKDSIAAIVKQCKEFLEGHPTGLILLSAYNIGKERIICKVQDELKRSIYMDEDRIKLSLCLDEDIQERVKDGRLHSNRLRSNIHICRMGFAGSIWPFFRPNFDSIEKLRHELNQEMEIEVEAASPSLLLALAPPFHVDDTDHDRITPPSSSSTTSPSAFCSHSSTRNSANSPISESSLQLIPAPPEEEGSSCSSKRGGYCVRDDGKEEHHGRHVSPSPRTPVVPSPGVRRTAPIDAVLAFIPTGWAASSNYNMKNSTMQKDDITVQLIPYSEHSQCEELLEFIRFLKPKEVVPTVYSDEKNKRFIVDLFRNCVDRKQNLRSFIATIAGGGGGSSPSASSSSPSFYFSSPPLTTSSATYLSSSPILSSASSSLSSLPTSSAAVIEYEVKTEASSGTMAENTVDDVHSPSAAVNKRRTFFASSSGILSNSKNKKTSIPSQQADITKWCTTAAATSSSKTTTTATVGGPSPTCSSQSKLSGSSGDDDDRSDNINNINITFAVTNGIVGVKRARAASRRNSSSSSATSSSSSSSREAIVVDLVDEECWESGGAWVCAVCTYAHRNSFEYGFLQCAICRCPRR